MEEHLRERAAAVADNLATDLLPDERVRDAALSAELEADIAAATGSIGPTSVDVGNTKVALWSNAFRKAIAPFVFLHEQCPLERSNSCLSLVQWAIRVSEGEDELVTRWVHWDEVGVGWGRFVNLGPGNKPKWTHPLEKKQFAAALTSGQMAILIPDVKVQMVKTVVMREPMPEPILSVREFCEACLGISDSAVSLRCFVCQAIALDDGEMDQPSMADTCPLCTLASHAHCIKSLADPHTAAGDSTLQRAAFSDSAVSATGLPLAVCVAKAALLHKFSAQLCAWCAHLVRGPCGRTASGGTVLDG